MWGDSTYKPKVRQWEQKTWPERVEAFLKSPDDPGRFDWPFPMGVFGTLRSHQGNNPLMHRGKVAKVRAAFLPHFYAHGLSIGFAENSSAPFEMFFYEPEEWVKMIGRVDSLESFDPTYHHEGKYEGGYYRTLAWLRLAAGTEAMLNEAQMRKWFPTSERAGLYEYRDIEVDPDTWETFDKVPCWIYSSIRQNRETCKKVKDSPVIWPTGL
jgi:hypothetical protein